MKVFKSLRLEFIIIIVFMLTMIFALQTGISIYQFKSTLDVGVEKSLKLEAEKSASIFSYQLSRISKTSELLANNIEAMTQYDTNLLLATVTRYIEAEPFIVGGGFWMEPFAYKPDAKYFGPYVARDTSNKIQVTWEYSTPEADYFKESWYKLGLASKTKMVWTQPYEDTVTKVPMITAVSQINVQGKVVGITTFDVGLKELQDYVANIKVGQNGYAFIISQEGYYLGHKDSTLNMKEKITESKETQLKELGNQITTAKETSVGHMLTGDTDNFVVYTPIGDTGMKLVLVQPVAEIHKDLYAVVLTNIISFIVAIALFISVVMYIFNRNINRPIGLLVDAAKRIANGDLLVQVVVNSENEIGVLSKSINIMVENIKKIVASVMQSAEHMVASSQQLTAHTEHSAQSAEQVSLTISDVANGTAKQLSAVKNSLDEVERMSTSIDEIAKNANIVVNMTNQTATIANQGGSAIETAINQISNIEFTVVQSADVVSKLGESSKEIGQIVDTISGIASQTNLLALNAAIEAARAGEQGRGFSVVAEEVRKLAEQSQDAAKKIAILIGDIQSETDKAVTSMQKGTAEVKVGTEVVNIAGKAFTDIINMVNNVSPKIEEISSAMHKMALGSQQIVKSVREIDDLSRASTYHNQTVSASTEEQVATIEEIASSSQSLAKLAEELQTSVNNFKI